MQTCIVHNKQGRRFRLYISGSGPALAGRAAASLQPQAFGDLVFAKQFVRQLDVPQNRLQQIVSERSTLNGPRTQSELENQLASLLLSGRITAYRLPESSPSAQQAQAFKGRSNEIIQIVPASTLLLHPQGEPKTFSSAADALAWLDALDPDIEQLTQMASGLDVNLPAGKQQDFAEVATVLAKALAQGTAVVLIEQKENRSELKHEEIDAAPQMKAPTLGPATNTAAAPVKQQTQKKDSGQTDALVEAAAAGAAFCEDCENRE